MYDCDTAAGMCPYCGKIADVPTASVDVSKWITERKTIMASMEYAYAMGHGCTVGGKTIRQQRIIQRVEVLDALIAEHSL